MSVVFDLPLFWLYLGQRHYWRDISYTSAYKRWFGLRVGRLFLGFVWVSRESVPVHHPEYTLPMATKPDGGECFLASTDTTRKEVLTCKLGLLEGRE
jgi:hypothetical protein